jgi:putative tricarboxylic transport membrane protein
VKFFFDQFFKIETAGDPMKENTRNIGDIIASLLLIAGGIGIAVGSINYKVGTFLDPQPGFFPLMWGILMVGLSSTLLVKGWMGRGKKTEGFGEVWRPAILMAGLGIYVGILEPLGYVLATFLITPFILRVMGVKSWKVLVLNAVFLPVGSHLLFVRMMGLQLPAGVLKVLF